MGILYLRVADTMDGGCHCSYGYGCLLADWNSREYRYMSLIYSERSEM